MELEMFAVLVRNFDRQRSVALWAEDRCWRIGKQKGWCGARVRWLTHTGREVSPSGLKTDAGASGKEEGWCGARVRWLKHTDREVSPSGLEDRC